MLLERIGHCRPLAANGHDVPRPGAHWAIRNNAKLTVCLKRRSCRTVRFFAPVGGFFIILFFNVFRGLFLIQKFARLVTPPLRSISLVDGQGKRYHTLERMVQQNSFCSRYILVFV